ncbi:MAG: C39 family peptidase [Nocardioides sp.]|nr:C39 family peptidase [Nocardioides sp.]
MTRHIRYDAWSRADGRTRREADGSTAWTSPWCEPGFAFTELVASWSVTTPRRTWVEIAAQARGSRVWHELGQWSSGARPARRTSVTGDPEVETDVWRPAAAALGYRLRVRLHGSTPELHRIGAVVTAGKVRGTTSSPLRQRERVIDVPRLSQMTWKEVGGRGWCSPTSVSMVLCHAGTLPPATDTGSIDVAQAARLVHDPAWKGTGNWSFNSAWAASLAGNAFITRLHDLRDAERFIDAGLPLVASVAYPTGSLRGAPTRATDGHLVVIRGFTAAGGVVTNDPAAPTERSVRRTYDRGDFERAWLQGSGGTVYVVHRDDQPLPSGSRGAW